jgi:serine/threonine protein kinase
LKKLDHPNVVHLEEIFRHNLQDALVGSMENVCIVMEFVDGSDLEEYLEIIRKQHVRLPIELVIKWIVQLCRAITHLHSRNVVHRDMKPANVLIQRDTLDLKITDFGLARNLRPESVADTVCGTDMYMAPEMRLEKDYGSKVDVWSLGLILFELITGREVDDFEAKSVTSEWNNYFDGICSELQVESGLRLLLKSMLLWDPSERMRMKGVVNSTIFRGACFLFGHTPSEIAETELKELVKDDNFILPLRTALFSSDDTVVSNALVLCEQITTKRPSTAKLLLDSRSVRKLKSLAESFPEAKRLCRELNLDSYSIEKNEANTEEAPKKWQSLQGELGWIDMDQQMSRIVEIVYQQYEFVPALKKVLVGLLLRNGSGKLYSLNLRKMKLRNRKGVTYRIRRTEAQGSSASLLSYNSSSVASHSNSQWQYQTASGSWKDFSSSASKACERTHHLAQKVAKGESPLYGVLLCVNEVEYTVDFQKMTQLCEGRERKVRRITILSEN